MGDVEIRGRVPRRQIAGAQAHGALAPKLAVGCLTGDLLAAGCGQAGRGGRVPPRLPGAAFDRQPCPAHAGAGSTDAGSAAGGRGLAAQEPCRTGWCGLAVGDAQARAGQYAAARRSKLHAQAVAEGPGVNNLAGVLMNDSGWLKTTADRRWRCSRTSEHASTYRRLGGLPPARRDRAPLLRDARLRAPDPARHPLPPCGRAGRRRPAQRGA